MQAITNHVTTLSRFAMSGTPSRHLPAMGLRTAALEFGQGQSIPASGVPVRRIRKSCTGNSTEMRVNYDECYDQVDSCSEEDGSVAINLVHRPDLDARVEKLASCLGLRGRGRKTAVIERALTALEEQERTAQLDPTAVTASLQRYIENGTNLSSRLLEDGMPNQGQPLSALLQQSLYDERGLPR